MPIVRPSVRIKGIDSSLGTVDSGKFVKLDANGKLDSSFISILSSSNNFSYSKVSTGVNLVIPDDQQMMLFSSITIDGSLQVDGELITGVVA